METEYFFSCSNCSRPTLCIIIIMETSIHTSVFYQHQNENWVTRLYYDILIRAIENGIHTYSDFHLSRLCAIPFSTASCIVDLFLSRKSNQRNYCFENYVKNIDLRLQIFTISLFPEEIRFHIRTHYWESPSLSDFIGRHAL